MKTDMQGLVFSAFWKMQDGAYVLERRLSAGVADLKGRGRASLATEVTYLTSTVQLSRTPHTRSTLLTPCYNSFPQHWRPLLEDGKIEHFQIHQLEDSGSIPSLYKEGENDSLPTLWRFVAVFMFLPAWQMSSAYDPFPNYQANNWKYYNGSVNRLNWLQMDTVE